MTEIRITVPGKPVGKGRPRFAKLPTGRMVAYTPEKTRSWESIVRASAQDAMGTRELLRKVTYIMCDAEEFGLQKGFCILGLTGYNPSQEVRNGG